MFTFFYVIDLAQDFNSKYCLSIAKKSDGDQCFKAMLSLLRSNRYNHLSVLCT
jgi:hypothetical protein